MVKRLLFVVQKHAATRLHYDLRLQIGETMPSWSIPKGPTLDNEIKRLAMETTDHTLEYRNFEGVIPEGHAGAGPVMIWDKGYFIPEIEITKGVREEIQEYSEAQKIMHDGFKKGELKFCLYGTILKGSFALVKTNMGGMKNAWLLIKHKDIYAKSGFDAKLITKSVESGKAIEELNT